MSVVQASPDESRSAESSARLGAFLTLGGVMAAHALLETARDALFLTHVSADRLPWVYLGIAVLALLIARLARGHHAHNNRARLIAAQLAGAAGTLVFWWLVDRDAAWTFYALYIWAGLISSLIVVGFWLCLGDLFTITQGKRLYASIGTGGALGALAGFGLATLLSVGFDADILLLFSAALFAISALGPPLLLRPQVDTHAMPIEIDGGEPGLLDQLSLVGRHPYARRVAGLVLVSTATLTLGDFLFKSLIAHHVESDRLATWFGGIYLALNTASVLLLLFVVTPTIRRLSVHRALAVLPGLIVPAAVAVILVGGLVPILLLKAADGALRYSLQKTASELLYLPLASGIRESVKTFVDLAGQHGAKALASIAILVIVPIPDHDLWIAVATVGLGGIWLFLAIEIRDAYLDVFRQTLSEGSIETRIDFPALDLASLESLIRTLSHPDERRVIAAMELLAEKDRVDLIPSPPTRLPDARRPAARARARRGPCGRRARALGRGSQPGASGRAELEPLRVRPDLRRVGAPRRGVARPRLGRGWHRRGHRRSRAPHPHGARQRDQAPVHRELPRIRPGAHPRPRPAGTTRGGARHPREQRRLPHAPPGSAPRRPQHPGRGSCGADRAGKPRTRRARARPR
jgi:ATP/ADP translocase